MDAYIYCADIYCADCGQAIRARLDAACKRPVDLGCFDSNDYPAGPYGNGGGEADSPQHCGSCRAFLENPLTTDGEEYVRQAYREALTLGVLSDAVKEWREYYTYVFQDEES